LNSTLPYSHHVEKEVSHGQQAEEKEEEDKELTFAPARQRAAPSISNSRGALSGVS
jgi:hypothetical protein